MLSERDIELAHPEAFDFAWGNLPRAQRAEFNRHLGGCRYCQAIVDEYSDIGQIIKNLPPHVEPPADLEDQTVAAMVATLAGQTANTDRRSDAEGQAATRVYPIPERQHPAESETKVRPRPQFRPPAEDDTGPRPSLLNQPAPAEPEARPMVTRLPMWRRYRGRLAAVVAVAAIIAAAVIVPLSLGGGLPAEALTFKLVPPPGSGQVASGTAVARPDASGSWDITLTVHHLKNFDDKQWYQCWYISRDGRQVASAGTFHVPESGTGTFSMTSAVDPNVFPTMEIRLQLPSKDGAIQGPVVLSGKGKKAKQ
jgi:hypothetical protein